MKQQGMPPDVISYNTLISACQKCEQPEGALRLFKAMRQQGVWLNVLTYNVLISACPGARPTSAPCQCTDPLLTGFMAPLWPHLWSYRLKHS